MRNKRGFIAVGVLAAGMGLAGTGAASARPATTVLSDSIQFSGIVKPGTTAGSFTFQSTKCAMVSDGEQSPFVCQLSGKLAKAATFAGFTGTAQSASKDGQLNWHFNLLPVAGTPSWKLNGSGIETDAPDPGQPAPKPYAAGFVGQFTFNAAFTAVHGTVQVRESSTAP